MTGLDNYAGPRPARSATVRSRLAASYLAGQARAAANPRRPGRPRLEGRPITARELAAAVGISTRTAWRYIAEARRALEAMP